MDKNDHVVIGIFEDPFEARAAIEKLKQWDKDTHDVKLGAIGLLYKDGSDVKTKVGHQTGRGAKVGAVVGVIAGVLSGGLAAIPAAAGGALVGGALGAFFKQSLHLTENECNAIGMDLDLGKAALVLTVDEYEVTPASLTMHQIGGEVRTYMIPADAIHEASQALHGEEKSGSDAGA
jgi:outer membrane lipoprotein SlyB